MARKEKRDNSKLRELMQEYGVRTMEDVHNFVKMLTAETIQTALDAELESELAELKTAISENTNIDEEIGDLIFSAVNVARFLKVDSEQATEKACNKFIGRFTIVENLANERGISLKDAELEELNKLWDEAKKEIYSNDNVKVTTADGVIFGKGFISDERFENWRIKSMTGSFYVDEEN